MGVPLLLSLFCGAGGLDLGFEGAGLNSSLAYDIRPHSISSYNGNRADGRGRIQDIRELSLKMLDQHYGGGFAPIGIIGGPPCQSFSGANTSDTPDDPRHSLPLEYARLVRALNARSRMHFFVFENVVGLIGAKHREVFDQVTKLLHSAGFNVSHSVLNSANYGVPQKRRRLIVVGFNRAIYGNLNWVPPIATVQPSEWRSVRAAIGHLPAPTFFRKGIEPEQINHHPNHWCMQPKSIRFSARRLTTGDMKNRRSFKTLAWDQPSPTVAYGNREVHVHPNCERRLSVHEAMLLQGFPIEYVLRGNLSEQITQVSEAVPPPMAKAVAESIRSQLGL